MINTIDKENLTMLQHLVTCFWR